MVERLTNLIGIFARPELDFSQNRAEHDNILGDAYEYLMRHFATESGKRKGQFYTPAEVTGSGPKAARVASFKWVNTALGNIKSAITGTYRKLGPDHAERYLASFAWRYNRRYHLQTMIPRFVHSAARTSPIPYQSLIAG